MQHPPTLLPVLILRLPLLSLGRRNGTDEIRPGIKSRFAIMGFSTSEAILGAVVFFFNRY